MSEPNQPKIFQVFARFRYEEPLHYVGDVSAPDADLAKVYAFNTYNEWAWIEMIVVPREAVVHVIEPA
ncbi:MAG: hypothetical protein ACM3S0_03920 [Acidobacteriota bacterium]|jgi:hypothetical protein